MKRLRKKYLSLFVVAALIPATGIAQDIGTKLDRRLLDTARPAETAALVWVFFTDKGPRELRKEQVPESIVSRRSIERRAKVLPAGRVVDISDLPLEEPYAAAVTRLVTRIRQRSKWMNAVSVLATTDQMNAVAALPFVTRVEPAMRLARKPAPGGEFLPATPPGRALPKTGGTGALDYGLSLSQINSINAVPVHNTGNHGQGVLIGVFDNGFRLPNHQTFSGLNIVATYDFVDKKQSVVPINPSVSFGSHGVWVLSTIAGYTPGSLIGPAFGASYVLARTENDSSETPFEEDNWVAAIEWADSIGIQISTTSLAYLGYEVPYTSWTWQNMNGRTTVISRAAAMAVRKGIVVVNSAGNDGSGPNFPNQNTLGAPADADSVLAVGAVTTTGTRAGFSSVGPTTSVPPRIKPDVMAQGTNIVAASSSNVSGYLDPGSNLQGTSFSCPLTAGAVALILKAHPGATPMQIVGALKATASRASAPDNAYGWGIINTDAAIQYLTGLVVPPAEAPAEFRLEQNYPNPFNPVTTIRFSIVDPQFTILKVFDLLGREVAVLANGHYPAGSHTVTFDAAGLAGGIYICRLTAQPSESGRAGPTVQTIKMTLVR